MTPLIKTLIFTFTFTLFWGIYLWLNGNFKNTFFSKLAWVWGTGVFFISLLVYSFFKVSELLQ